MKLRFFFGVILLVGVAGCGPSEGPKGDAAAGRALAERNCARCHAVGMRGDSPVTAAPPFQEIATRWPPEYLAEALAEGILVNHTSADVAMPEFRLEPSEIDDLIAYLHTLSLEE